MPEIIDAYLFRFSPTSTCGICMLSKHPDILTRFSITLNSGQVESYWILIKRFM